MFKFFRGVCFRKRIGEQRYDSKNYIHTSVFMISVGFLPACLSVCPTVCLSTCPPSARPSGCLSVRLFVCLSICPPSACPSVCLSVCLFVCLSVWLSVSPSDCLSAWPSVSKCLCLFVCLPVCFLMKLFRNKYQIPLSLLVSKVYHLRLSK